MEYLAELNWIALAILVVEWYLGQTDRVKSNSTIDLILSMILPALRRLKKKEDTDDAPSS